MSNVKKGGGCFKDAALEKFMFLGKGSLRRVKPSERKVSAMCANSEEGDLLAGGG